MYSLKLTVIVVLIVEELSADSLRIQSYDESLHISPQLLALSELEFKKAFLLLSYIPGYVFMPPSFLLFLSSVLIYFK